MKAQRIHNNLLWLLCCLFFSLTALAQQNSPILISQYDEQQYRKEIEQALIKLRKARTWDTRLQQASQIFLAKPYALGPLGEGKQSQFDQNPLYRTDVFDCETYVDTVLALVAAYTFPEFSANMIALRYANRTPLFLERNHFTHVDWNSHNQRKGFVVDITAPLFPQHYKTARTYINKPQWFASLSYAALKLLQLPSHTTPNQLLQQLRHQGQYHSKAVMSILDYVPLSELFDPAGNAKKELFQRIPHGVVIEIVRPNWNLVNIIGTELDISHMGLGLRQRGQLVFRQASSVEKEVIDVRLEDYLRNYLHSSTIKGIHIEQIQL